MAEGLKDTLTTSLAHDPAGGFWVGYMFDGVDYFDYGGTPTDKADDVWVNFGPSDGLGDTGAVPITVEPGKGVWFGHFYGVSFLNYGADPLFKGDDVWVTYDQSDGLVFPWVRSIAIDPAGRKWIGTWDGVSCFDDGGTPWLKGDDQWQSFPIKEGPTSMNMVTSIAVDLNGVKWIGTMDRGVLYLDDGGTPFDQRDDISYYSGEKNGLASDHVGWSIVIDSANGKWVATSRGLCYLP